MLHINSGEGQKTLKNMEEKIPWKDGYGDVVVRSNRHIWQQISTSSTEVASGGIGLEDFFFTL